MQIFFRLVQFGIKQRAILTAVEAQKVILI